MLNHIRQKLARFRSELHMSRYAKAIKEGQNLITMLKQADEYKLLTDAQTLIDHIKQQIQLAIAIEKLITQGTDNRNVDDIEQKRNKAENKINSQSQVPSKWGKSKQGQKVGKWGKKSQFKNSPQKQMMASQSLGFSYIASNSSIQNWHLQEEQKKVEEKGEQNQLAEDERQILERQIILPLNIPQFFKNKEPHRLIVCFYEKCRNLIKMLRQQISQKKQVIELEDLNQWTAQGKQDFLRIYVAPFPTDQQKLVCEILQDGNNFLVLYSQTDRQLLTEKLTNLKKQGYRLKF